MERHVDALKTNKTGDERQTEAEVFDRQTLMVIYDFMTSDVIESVHHPISTGKEGNVFYCTDYDGEPVALKIFRTSTSTFKRVAKYIEGDPRFRGALGNRRRMIYTWTAKEYRNLVRYYEAELPVPEPYMFRKNCLLMEYIGDKHGPAPQLKDIPMQAPDRMYRKIIDFIDRGFNEAGLVHGDLSEYNILIWKGQPVVIDCGQAMTADFFNAEDFLRRDINNINRFFANRGAEVEDTETIMERILAEDEDDYEEEDEE